MGGGEGSGGMGGKTWWELDDPVLAPRALAGGETRGGGVVGGWVETWSGCDGDGGDGRARFNNLAI